MHKDALPDSNCELVQTVPVALDLSVDVEVSVGSKLFRCGQWKGKSVEVESVVVCRIRWNRSRIVVVPVVVSVVVPVTVGSSVVDVP